MRAWRAACVAATLLAALVPSAWAQPLVLTWDSGAEVGAEVSFDAAALGAAVDAAVDAAGRGAASEIALELAPGVVVQSRAVWSERRAGGGLTWSGSVAGDGLGHVLLTAEPLASGGYAVVGQVVAAGDSYAVRYEGARHRVRAIGTGGDSCGADAAPDAPGPSSALGRGLPRIDSPQRDVSPSEADTVSVLLLYTDAAALALGDELPAFLQALLDTANDRLVRSAVPGRVAWVGTHEVPEPEGLSTAEMLTVVTTASGDAFDDVHLRRLEAGADLVFLLPEGGSNCGSAFIPDAEGSPEFGFGVVRQSCSRVLANFAHEIGHNLGLRHDPYVDPRSKPFPYGHGYTDAAAAEPFRTTMAYPDACTDEGVDCPEVPYFANPDLTLGGRPLGEPEFSDAARALREMMPVVSGYLTGPTALPDLEAPDLNVTVAEDGAVLIEPPAQETALNLTFERSSPLPWHGSIDGLGTAQLTYTPDADFFGADSFAYRIRLVEWNSLWQEGKVRVEVEPVPDAAPYPSEIVYPENGRHRTVSPVSEDSILVRWSEMTHPDYPGGDVVLHARWRLTGQGNTYLERTVSEVQELRVSVATLDSVLVARGVEPYTWTVFYHNVYVFDANGGINGPGIRLRLRSTGYPGGVDPDDGEAENPDDASSGPIPDAPELYGAFPNPAREAVRIRIGSPDANRATVTLFDALGRAVQTTERAVEAGANTLRLDVAGLPPGVYLFRVEVGRRDPVLRGRVTVL